MKLTPTSIPALRPMYDASLEGGSDAPGAPHFINGKSSFPIAAIRTPADKLQTSMSESQAVPADTDFCIDARNALGVETHRKTAEPSSMERVGASKIKIVSFQAGNATPPPLYMHSSDAKATGARPKQRIVNAERVEGMSAVQVGDSPLLCKSGRREADA